MTRPGIRSLVACAAVAALFALPGAAQAAVTIGSNLTSAGNENHGDFCGASGACTATNLSLPPANTAANGLTSPIAGVVVEWRVKSGSSGNPVALRVLRPAGGTSFTGAGTSTPGTTSTGTPAEFNSQLRIAAGDHIGLNIGNSGLVFATNPGATSVLWGLVNGFPDGLADGATAAGGTRNSELLVQAVVEPDADNDGLGDETQDPCPTEPGPTCSGGGDQTRPVITNQRVDPKRFQPAEPVTARGGSSVPAGTTIKFSLSEPAFVFYRIKRISPGRRVGNKCKKPTPANRDEPKCKRSKMVERLELPGTAGENSTPFSGTVDGKPLKPAKYEVTLVATDGAGNTSDQAKAKFRVVAPRN